MNVENSIVENSIDQSIFDLFYLYGCKFIKTVDKKNPRKELMDKFIAKNADVINEYLKKDPSHSIKLKLATNVYVLDIDAHEGSTLSIEQIEILDNHFAQSGFLTDRTRRRGTFIFSFRQTTL